MKIYYAHPMNIYNTDQEQRDLELMKSIFPNSDIYNPNNPIAEQGYKEKGMDYFYNIIYTCDLLIFRGLPFNKIPAGVYGEIEMAINSSIPILELPSLVNRKLSVSDTRTYLSEIGYR